MLVVEALKSGYGASQVLFDINLEVGDREVVTLLGRNGMGKTTSIMTILGAVGAWGGRVEFAGKSLLGLPLHAIARLGVGLVPEGRQVFPNLTVEENLLATRKDPSERQAAWSLDRVYDFFPALRARRSSLGVLLSGGEQQMLAIGRALMTNPRLLILDEATEGLAPKVRREIWTCLHRLKDGGQPVLLVDKNLKPLARIGDRHYIVEKGMTVWSGGSAELLGADGPAQRYLGV